MIITIIISYYNNNDYGTARGGGGARFSAPVQTDRGAHPASYTMGIGLSRG